MILQDLTPLFVCEAKGNLRGALTGAIQGAAVGGVTGGIAGAFGNGTTARMFSGGLNGAIQTGTPEGFARGMISGAVPTDLGMSYTYNNSAFGNALIGVARDGIRGYMINGAEGARANMIGGQVNNLVGHMHGYTMQRGWGAPTFQDGTWRYNVTSVFGSSGTPAIAFGNVIAMREGNDYNRPLTLLHEMEHANEQSALGASYLPLHAASQWTGSHFLEDRPYKYVGPY